MRSEGILKQLKKNYMSMETQTHHRWFKRVQRKLPERLTQPCFCRRKVEEISVGHKQD